MVMQSTDLFLPTQIADGIIESTKTGSVVAALSGQEPQRFGTKNYITFEDDLTAQFVEESGAKSSDEAKPAVVTATPHKAVVDFRTSDEFIWADEDYQLGVLQALIAKGSRALSRALDLGLLYRLNPRTGTEITAWTNYLNATTNRVVAAGNADAELRAAAALTVAANSSPTGIAMTLPYGGQLANTPAVGVTTPPGASPALKYPNLGFGNNITTFADVPVAQSSTVAGKPIDASTADNGVRAIVGDWSTGIRWGVQKQIPFRTIEFGDPDNTGRDLAGHNEVLLRAEIVFGWYVFPQKFAVIAAAPTPAGG